MRIKYTVVGDFANTMKTTFDFDLKFDKKTKICNYLSSVNKASLSEESDQ